MALLNHYIKYAKQLTSCGTSTSKRTCFTGTNGGLMMKRKKIFPKINRKLFTTTCPTITTGKPFFKTKPICDLSRQSGNSLGTAPVRTAASDSTGSALISTECEILAEPPCHRKRPKPAECKHKEPEKWPGPCIRVCMPCCKPIDPLKGCDYFQITLNTCEGNKYKYPSFSRVTNKVHFGMRSSDCCYWDECCRRTHIGTVSKLMTITDRQKLLLGYKKKPQLNVDTAKKFSTFTGTLWQKSGDNTCEKKGGLPCLKRDENALKKMPKSRKTCEKLCMPCCRQARDPPECFAPYKKPPCNKRKAPRPSFSECQDILRDVPPCECLPPVATCATKGSKDEEVGCRKKK